MITLDQWRKGLSKTEEWSIDAGDLHNLLDCACDRLDAQDKELAEARGRIKELFVARATIRFHEELLRQRDKQAQDDAATFQLQAGMLEKARAENEQLSKNVTHWMQESFMWNKRSQEERATIQRQAGMLEKAREGLEEIQRGDWKLKGVNDATVIDGSFAAIARKTLTSLTPSDQGKETKSCDTSRILSERL